MKRKGIVTAFAVLLALAVLAACSGTQPAEITGFTVRETVEVSYGANVTVETPIVTQGGHALDVLTLVADSKGGYVAVNGGTFRALDPDGYTILYRVRGTDGTARTKTTAVTVTGASSLTVSAEYEPLVDVGTQTVKPVCSDDSAEIAIRAVRVSDGAEMDVADDGTFVCDTPGAYDVTITATAGETAEYTYRFVAREPMAPGEVERFYEGWETAESLLGGRRTGWTVTTTEECGITAPDGEPGSFATFTTSDEYVQLFVNPRGDKAYYESLAADGYEYVSCWIYMDSAKSHQIYTSRDVYSGGFYQWQVGVLMPGVWKEVRMNLSDTYEDWKRSFITCYDILKSQEGRFYQIDNSDLYNAEGGGDTMTFYISDIYAVKPVEVTANETFPTEYVTGDTITLSDLCEADIDLDYTVTFRGRTTRVADGGDYTFTANGIYEVEAAPSRPDYAASVKKTLYVTDEFTVTGQNVAKRHETDAPVTVSFSEFGAAFPAVGGIAPEIKEYSVSRYGTAVPDDGNGFTVSADGGYDVDVRAEYVKDGRTYDTYGRLYADVYTDETAYDVISVSKDSMFVSTNYINSTWDTMPTFSVGTRTVGGVTERMFDIDKSSESLVALIRPLYSKAYYERLLADDPDLKVRFKYYVDPVNPGGENVLTFFRFGYDWATAAEYTWQRYTFDLSAFVDMYDGFLEGYDEVRDLVNGYESLTWASPSDWADNHKLWVYANVGKIRLYLTKMTVYGEADDCTAAVKPGQTVALCTDNDLAEILDVRISDQPAGLVSSEVWHLGAWHTLADNVFRPSFAGTYRMRLTAARGAQLGVFETTVTVEGDVIETTRDDGLYVLNDGGSFDLAETIAAPAGYTLTYEVRLALGNERTVTDIRPDGGVLHASDLPAYGCYEITALLVSPDSGPFNTMEYYTLLLDYAAADEPVWQGGITETTLAYAQGWYWSGNALDTVSLVTDPTETLTGNYIRLYDEMREQAALQLLPLHSKAFYEQFCGQGYTFVFDAAVIRAHDWQVRIVRSYDATTGTTGDVYTSGTEVHTIRIPLEYLLDHWDTFATKGTGDSAVRDIVAIQSTESMTGTGAYIGNFRMIRTPVLDTVTDETLHTADIADGATFDLTELLSEEVTEDDAFEYGWQLVTKAGTVIDLASATLDVAAYEGIYEVRYTATYPSTGDVQTAFVTQLEICGTAGPVWQGDITEETLAYAQGWYYNGTPVDTVSVATDPTAELTGTYLRLYDTREQAGLQLLPLHSKEYYEKYRGQGYELVFDIHVTQTGSALPTVRFYDDTHDGWLFWSFSDSDSYTVRIPLEHLLDNWGTFTTVAPETTDEEWGIYYLRNIVSISDTVSEVELYAGNFRLQGAPALDTVTDETLHTADIADGATFDLTELLSEEVTEDDAFEYGWQLVTKAGTVIDLASATLDVAAYEGIYEVRYTATYPSTGDVQTAFVTQLEICGTAGPVWQGDITEETLAYAQGWYYNGTPVDTVSVATDPTAELTGTYLRLYDTREQGGLQVLPLHSKEYYEKYRGQGYEVVFDATVMRVAESQNFALRYYYERDGWLYWAFRTSEETTYTVRIPLEHLLDNWDTFTAAAGVETPSDGYLYLRNFVTTQVEGEGYPSEVGLYVGNFRMETSEAGA